ncbi:MAG: hypothetical protein H8D05_01495 [FCB group bacterium]|nr:hypothetical protein [FCB group bacterium]
MKQIMFKSTVLAIVLEIILLAGAQVGAHNWLLSLSMKEKVLLEQQQELCWERNDLIAEISELLILDRLENIGGRLGLIPLPLERHAIIRLPHNRIDTGDVNVANGN